MNNLDKLILLESILFEIKIPTNEHPLQAKVDELIKYKEIIDRDTSNVRKQLWNIENEIERWHNTTSEFEVSKIPPEMIKKFKYLSSEREKLSTHYSLLEKESEKIQVDVDSILKQIHGEKHVTHAEKAKARSIERELADAKEAEYLKNHPKIAAQLAKDEIEFAKEDAINDKRYARIKAREDAINEFVSKKNVKPNVSKLPVETKSNVIKNPKPNMISKTNYPLVNSKSKIPYSKLKVGGALAGTALTGYALYMYLKNKKQKQLEQEKLKSKSTKK